MAVSLVEQVRESAAFKNLVTGMDRVFPQGWRMDRIYPSDKGLDFVAQVHVADYDNQIFICVVGTPTGGGLVTASVTWPGPPRPWLTPERTRAIAVDTLIGTPVEKELYRSGINGDNVDAIESYLHILKRYTDGQRSTSRLADGQIVHGTVVARHRWGVELELDDLDIFGTVDIRFISDDPGDMNPDRFPRIGARFKAKVQCYTPSDQLRLTIRESDVSA